MGALLQAECVACGHEVELLAGLGFEGIELESRVCLDCREIVSVAVEDRLHRPDPLPDLNQCPDRGGKNLQPLPQVLNGDEAEPSVPSVPCPRCDASMNVYSSGTWD
jgi:hypothetical protein